MKQFFVKAFLFWFVLLLIAIANAILREATYEPWLVPYLGMWAHQVSALVAIVAFFGAIYWFLWRVGYWPSTKELVGVGWLWIGMTIGFESWMNLYVRKLSFSQVLETYYLWKGELWPLVLLSLVVSPLVIRLHIINKKRNQKESS